MIRQENKIFILTLLCIALLIFVSISLYYSVIKRNQNLYLEDKLLERTTDALENEEKKNLDSPYKPQPTIGIKTIPTKGVPTNFVKIGIIVNEDKSKILPLYSRNIYANSNKYNYYTKTDGFQSESLPIRINGRNCTEPEIGCDEIYSGDSVYVDELGQNFKVEIYKNDNFVYNPNM